MAQTTDKEQAINTLYHTWRSDARFADCDETELRGICRLASDLLDLAIDLGYDTSEDCIVASVKEVGCQVEALRLNGYARGEAMAFLRTKNASKD